MLAQGYASRIYHSIGIDLRWNRSCPKGALTVGFKTVGIEWAGKASLRLQPGAWASARPFQRTGNRITLYLDRLADVLAIGPSAAAVLGHVLAHEIGHVLLGHNGHSTEGLLKARWSQADQSTMAHRLMEFTADEQEQLLRRLDRCR